MNHQPFEDWLLNDKPMTQQQKHELDLHIRTCVYCAALAETGIALKSVKKVSPKAGFTDRFQARLIERKIAEQRRRLWGSVLFTLGGLVLLMGIASPFLLGFFSAPATWIAAFIQWVVFIVTTVEALAQAGSVFVRILPDFLSPFGWMVLISALAGVSLLWTVSIWRFVRVPRVR